MILILLQHWPLYLKIFIIIQYIMSKDPNNSLVTNSYDFLPPKNVEIIPKLAKMLQMYETCVKVVWGSVKEWVKVCESITNEFTSLCTYLFTTNMVEKAKNWPISPTWVIVWMYVKECVKMCKTLKHLSDDDLDA